MARSSHLVRSVRAARSHIYGTLNPIGSLYTLGALWLCDSLAHQEALDSLGSDRSSDPQFAHSRASRSDSESSLSSSASTASRSSSIRASALPTSLPKFFLRNLQASNMDLS